MKWNEIKQFIYIFKTWVFIARKFYEEKAVNIYETVTLFLVTVNSYL